MESILKQQIFMNKIPIGYQAIIEQLDLKVIPHFRQSYLAQGRSQTLKENHHEIHIYPKTYALKRQDDLLENLEFALKYEGINLEIIQSSFEKISKHEVVNYIQKQPMGIYSRKIWFLYEFLMDELLPLADCKRTKYIDLLDINTYVTSQPIKSMRHRINNNLLGNRHFCPFVRHTQTIEKYIQLKLDDKVKKLLEKYQSSLIARASYYLYTKETLSSYQIEKEQPDQNRMNRFVHLLHEAQKMESLSKQDLIELQNFIVDARFKDNDYRSTQNYVGENTHYFYQKIHYISPKPEDVPTLMAGLLAALEKMLSAKIHPVIIAAAIAFGFVFIHPFEDGNGRIHRFLIHYILSKDHFTPKEMIFPISSVMLNNLQAYDAILESFSKPLLSVLTTFDLTDEGVMSVKQPSQHYYPYIDYTQMVEYLFQCIEIAINEDIAREINFLLKYDKTKHTIQAIVDMPDKDIDLFIKLVIQNHGRLSIHKRQRFFPLLTDREIHQIIQVIQEVMLDQR